MGIKIQNRGKNMSQLKIVSVTYRGSEQGRKIKNISKSGDVRIDAEEVRFMVMVAIGQIVIENISDGNIVLGTSGEKQGYFEIKAPVSYWDKVRLYKNLIRKTEIFYSVKYPDRDFWKDNRVMTLSTIKKEKSVVPVTTEIKNDEKSAKPSAKSSTKKKIDVNPDAEF